MTARTADVPLVFYVLATLVGACGLPLSFGVLSYGFLAYCVLLGQANEQLTVYSAAPAVLLAVLAWATRCRSSPRPRA